MYQNEIMKRNTVGFLITVSLVMITMVLSCSEKVRDLRFSDTKNQSAFSFFRNEIKPVPQKPCFEGAYYRKLVSSSDLWRGISGRVVLPELHFDEQRINPKKPKQYLDNPSVYLGGSMGDQETDIGLAWEIVKDEKGLVSADRKAFRPFLRRTEHVSGQHAVFENAPAESKYYWYPGEEVYMSVQIISEKRIRFIVEGAGKKFERDFDCDGYSLSGFAEFKRVNAIDQVANEGHPVKLTQTRVLHAQWKGTNLYREINGEVKEVPFHSGRYTAMACPAASNFQIKASAEDLASGAEEISISGKGF